MLSAASRSERTHWTSTTGATATLIEPGGVLPLPTSLATDVVLVRHAETDWNRAGRCQGIVDTSLNVNGVLQAKALRRLVADADISAAYSSPLLRARETARLMLDRTGVAASPVADLREIDCGRLTGLALDEWESIDPGLGACWRNAPWEMAFPGGERLSAARGRAMQAWDSLVAAHRGDRILIVGHGHLNRLLVLHAVNADARMFWRVPQPNAAVWHVRIGAVGAGWSS
jgi:probable phosphoglycerate mutase